MFTHKDCKAVITRIRPNQKYHCRNCFLLLTTKPQICPECGNSFKRKSSSQICCKPACTYSYRAKKNTKGKTIPCSFDGKPIHIMPSRIKENNFCNNVCKFAWLKSDKNPYKKRKHTPEEIEKIRIANEKRNYDEIFTEKTRQKLRINAKNTILRPDVIEKTKNINRKRLTGTKLPEGTIQKIRLHAKYGENNNMWRGAFASYYAWHMWVYRHKGKPQECIDKMLWDLECKGRMEWSNVDHEYERNLDDYEPRCTRHHRIYDIIQGLTTQWRFLPQSVYRFLQDDNKVL